MSKSIPFTAQMLQNKEDDTIKNILVCSYEYMLIKIAGIYSRQSDISTIEDFNINNKVSYYLTLVYPFFVSLSDGNSEALYSLFGEFYSLDFGPSSMSIHSTLEKQPQLFNHFEKNSTKNPFGVRIINPLPTFELVENSIESTVISPGILNQRFDEISIINDKGQETSLAVAITKGIRLLNELSKNRFFLSDEKTLLSQASYFTAFEKAYRSDRLTLLTYADVVADKGRPSYEPRTLVRAYAY